MLVAVNVGNSRISFGFFKNESCELVSKFKISTDINKTSDEYLALIKAVSGEINISGEGFDDCIFSSVVPQLNSVISETLERFTGISPKIVGPGLKTGFPIKIDTPSELGADIVANTAAVIGAAREKGDKNFSSIVIDMGTVTTVSAINKNGEYIGCSIFPGVGISFDAMHGKTAQLPNVMPDKPQRAIGKNSRDSLRSGIILGNSMILDGMCEKFAKEMKVEINDTLLLATGEYAESVIASCKNDFVYEENLTLKGLWYLFDGNRQK